MGNEALMKFRNLHPSYNICSWIYDIMKAKCTVLAQELSINRDGISHSAFMVVVDLPPGLRLSNFSSGPSRDVRVGTLRYVRGRVDRDCRMILSIFCDQFLPFFDSDILGDPFHRWILLPKTFCTMHALRFCGSGLV